MISLSNASKVPEDHRDRTAAVTARSSVMKTDTAKTVQIRQTQSLPLKSGPTVPKIYTICPDKN